MAAAHKPHTAPAETDREIHLAMRSGERVSLDVAPARITGTIRGDALYLDCEGGACYVLEDFATHSGGVAFSSGLRFASVQDFIAYLDAHDQLLGDGQSGPGAPSVAEAAELAGTEVAELASAEGASALPAGSPAEGGAEQNHEAGHEGDGGTPEAPASGGSSYRDGADDLAGSVTRLGAQGAFYWHDRDGARGSGSGLEFSVQAAILPPTVSLGFTDGPSYPGFHTVMESDSFGMLLDIRLSQASNGADALMLQFGGTAKMALFGVQSPTDPGYNSSDDYVDWQHWTIVTPQGEVPATELMSQSAADTYSLMLPPGISSFSIKVPLLDNDLSQPDRTFTYRVLSSGGYVLAEGETETILIIDEDNAASPPEPGDPGIDPGINWGATARIQVEQSPGQWGHDLAVMENRPGDVNYRFELVDTHTGNPIAGPLPEDVKVTITIAGRNGLELDPLNPQQDFKLLEDIGGIVDTFKSAGYSDAAYDPATGQLTFTVPAAGPFQANFTGKTVADSRDESRADGSHESLVFEVQAEGAEVISGRGASTDVVDTPTVSVRASCAEIFESKVSGHALDNQVTFTFSQSSVYPGQEHVDVNLEWGQGAGFVQSGDYQWSYDGTTWHDTALPPAIRFAAGEKNVSVIVRAVDDKLSESDELITVTIKPENGAASPSDSYHVHQTQNNQSVTLYDDTTSHAYGNNGAHEDGPIVRIMPCDAAGNVIGTNACTISEKSGEVHFRPVLYDRATGLPVSSIDEDIDVTFTLTPKGGAQFNLDSLLVGDDFAFSTGNNKYTFTPVFADPPANSVLSHYEVTVSIDKATFDATPDDFIFDGRIIADSQVEAGEGFVISVQSTNMHESAPGADYDVTFADAPVLSITAGAANYYEDSGLMKFTVTADVAVQEDTVVWLELGGAGGNAEDLILDLAGSGFETVTSNDGTKTYIKVTIPDGATSVDLNLPIRDDVYSPKPDGSMSTDGKESREETVSLKIVNQGGVDNPAPYPPYGISLGSNTAQSKIIDDSTGHGAHPAHPDGPVVLLLLTDDQGAVLTNPDGTPLRATEALEYSSQDVHYKVALFERAPDGSIATDGSGNWKPYTAVQDVTVEVDVRGYAGVDFKTGDKDFAFTAGPNVAFAAHASDNARGTITVTVPKGSAETSFKGNAIADLVPGEENERFDLSINSVNGNEAVLGDSGQVKVSTEIRDTPTARIFFGDGPGGAADRSHYSESEGSFSFTVTISDTSTEAVKVYLDWSGTDASILKNGQTLPEFVIIQPGDSSVTTAIAMQDNAFTASAKDIAVALKHDGGASGNAAGQKYHTTTADNALAGKVEDDTVAWQPAWGDEPADHGSLEGPRVILIMRDAGGAEMTTDEAARIKENGGQVKYELKVVDAATGNAYGGQREDIDVILNVKGANGFAANTDMAFALEGGGALTVNGSGQMTVTIPGNAPGLTIVGTARADRDVEASDPDKDGVYTQESVSLGIAGVRGNEACFDGTEKTITIIDVPTISVAAEHAYYSESPDPNGAVPHEMVFVFTLSSPPMGNVTVPLQWSAGLATPGTDYTGPSSTLPPASITFAPGQTEVVVRLPIVDDKFSENNESLTVTILPEQGAGNATVNDNYHVDAAEGSATTTIVDDTRAWPVAENDADNPCPPWHGAGTEYSRLDGPVAVINAKKGEGNHNDKDDPRYQDKKADGDARYDGDDRTAIALEKIGDTHNDIVYRVDLNGRGTDGKANGQAYACDEEVTLELTIAPKANMVEGTDYSSTYGENGDFYLDKALMDSQVGAGKAIKSYDFNDSTGKLTVVLNKGESGFDVPVKIVTDTLTEINRKIYDPDKAQAGDPDPFTRVDDEAFVITLDTVSGNEAAVDTDKAAITTIIDEDHEGLFVSIREYTGGHVPEGDEATFTLVLSKTTDEPVTVILRPKPGSGSGNEGTNHPASVDDFVAGDLEITIPANTQEKTFTVKTKQDLFSEGIEEFEIEIIYVSGGEAQINEQQKSTTCTIKDNMDGPVVGLEHASGSNGVFYESSLEAGSEVAGKAVFTLSLSAPPSDPPGPPAPLAPVETMTVTLKLEGGTDDFDWSLGHVTILDSGNPNIKVLEVNADGTIKIEIPTGYTGPNGDGKVDFAIDIKDDHLTEKDKEFSLKVEKTEGSESTIAPGNKGVVEGTIVDDPTVVANDNLGLEDANKLLDGPYVSLKGTEYVSESATTDYGGLKAAYLIELHKEDGSLYTSQETITVYVKFSSSGPDGAKWGDEFRADESLYPRETITVNGIAVECVKVTIGPGQTNGSFEFEVLDSVNMQSNKDFDLEIVRVQGNEARLMDSAYKTTTGLGDSIRTVIIDDTEPWQDSYNKKYTDGEGTEHEAFVRGGHGETGALDGLTLKLARASGSGSVSEGIDAGKIEYVLSTDDISASQDVDVTMKLAFNGGMSVEDFVAIPETVTDPAAKLALLEAAIKSANGIDPGADIKIAYIDNDPAKGVTFEVDFPENGCMVSVFVPIHNDALTERGESYTLSIEKAKGSEAQINTGKSSVTTAIHDDNSGPNIRIDCWDNSVRDSDNDGIKDVPDWVRIASIISNPKHGEYDDNANVIFRVHGGNRAAEEAITVSVKLCKVDGTTALDLTAARISEIIAANAAQGKSVTYDDVNGVFNVTIAKDDVGTNFYVPKNYKYDNGDIVYKDPATGAVVPEGTPGALPEYAGDRYTAVVSNPQNGEAYTHSTNNTAEVEIIPSSNPGPYTYVTIKTTDPKSDPGNSNSIPITEEGNNANFEITLRGSGHSEPEDQVKHDAHDLDNNNKLDGDLTITAQIRTIHGDVNRDDFNADILAANADIKDGSGTPVYKSITLSDDGKTLIIVINEGVDLVDGVGALTKFPLRLPVREDNRGEGYEQYQIKITGVSCEHGAENNNNRTGGGYDSTPVDMGISEADSVCKVSLAHAPSGIAGHDDQVMEGDAKAFYIVVDNKPGGSFTASLDYQGGTATGEATKGSDFLALPQTVTCPDGSDSRWVDLGNGKWGFKFEVQTVGDSLTEPDEVFSVSISSVSTQVTTLQVEKDTSNTTISATIVDDGLTGPLVYFTLAGQTVSEADGSMSFEVRLSKKSEEPVTVYLEVKDDGATMGYGTDAAAPWKDNPDSGKTYDYTLKNTPGYLAPDHPDNPFYSEYTGPGTGRHIIKVEIPKGGSLTTVNLPDSLLNDPYTEDPEKVRIEIVKVQGSEARIMNGDADGNHGDADQSAHVITIEDSLDGPKINISQKYGAISEGKSTNYGTTEDDGHAYPPPIVADPTTAPSHSNIYTVALEGDKLAEQEITVTLRVEAKSGKCEGILSGHTLGQNNVTKIGPIDPQTGDPGYIEVTLTIPAGQNKAEWDLGNVLINDKYVDLNDAFTVSIADVTGNETLPGDTTSVTTAIEDDDHAPLTVKDKIIMLIPNDRVNDTWQETLKINVLGNDSDEDKDILKTLAGSKDVSLGRYVIGEDGSLSYKLNGDASSVKNLDLGGKLYENVFEYTATDGYNQSKGTVELEVHATQNFSKGTGEAEWIFGTNTHDIIRGGGGADTISGGGGNDVIYDHIDGKATLKGDTGNDTFVLADTDPAKFSKIDGGEGTDVIKMGGNNIVADFTGAGGPDKFDNIASVEIIDVSGMGFKNNNVADTESIGNNTLKLDKQGVARLNEISDEAIIRINGNIGDRVEFTDGPWTAEASSGVPGYALYTGPDGVQVLVQDSLAIVARGTSAGETLDYSGQGGVGTGNYAIYGDDGNDILKGGAGHDQLYGGDGDDVLDGGGGAGAGNKDQLDGGDGNDLIYLHDVSQSADTGQYGYININDFHRVDGGSGEDTLRLANDAASDADYRLINADGKKVGVILDCTGMTDKHISGIEIIDLDGAGATDGIRNGIILTVDAFTSLAASNGTNELFISGKDGDFFELAGNGWPAPVTDSGFYVYDLGGGAKLYVEDHLTRRYTGTSGNDTITSSGEDLVLMDGGAGNDVLTGGAGDDSIYGGAGNDILRGGGGNNVLHGGIGNDSLYRDSSGDSLYGDEGNDTIVFNSGASLNSQNFGAGDFVLIAGGDGVDMLNIGGQGNVLDLTGVSAGQLTGVEVINITGAGDNHIVLDEASLGRISQNLADATKPLKVQGNAGDSYELQGDWQYSGRVNENGTANPNSGQWMVYEKNGQKVWIASAMRRSYSGTDAPDEGFILDDVTGDKIVRAEDFGRVDGKGGADDSVLLAGGGLTLDLVTGFGANKIIGIESINISHPDAADPNKLYLDADSVTKMGLTSLNVSGKSGDTIEFAGAWTCAPDTPQAGYRTFTGTDSSNNTVRVVVNNEVMPEYTGTSGADTLSIMDVTGDGLVSAIDFARIDGVGESGNTLGLVGDGTDIDLTGLGANQVKNIQTIDLTDANANGNHIKLDGASLAAMGVAQNGAPLQIKGDNKDTVELAGNWKFITTENGFHVYEDASARQVAVHSDIGRAFVGADGVNDVFTVYDLTGEGRFDSADYASIVGGTGTDSIKAGTDDLALNLTGSHAANIRGIECIDLSSTSNNSLRLDQGSLGHMGLNSGERLTVKGNNTDTFTLDGDWTYLDTVSGQVIYQDGSGRQIALDSAMKRVFESTGGPDRFVLDNVVKGDAIKGDDFAAVRGGSGTTDAIEIADQTHQATLDCTTFADGQVSGIERIILHDNKAVFDAASLKNMGIAPGGVMSLEGESGGVYVLKGDWTLENGAPAGYVRYSVQEGGDSYYLDVQSALIRAYEGTSGPDLFALDDIDGNGTITTEEFYTIHGGEGQDTIKINGAGTTLDLSKNIAGDTILSIEVIDLAGDGTNGLSITAATLNAMRGSDQATPLVITGAAGSRVLIDPAFVPQASLPDYYVFKNSQGNILHVDKNLAYGVGASGDSGNDTFILYDYAGDGVIEAGLFSINGEDGNDTVRLDGNGKLLDLSSATANSFANVEVIDLAGSGGNQLIAGGAALAAIRGTDTSTPLVIEGALNSEVSLSNGLVYQGLSGAYHVFTNSGGNILHVHNSLIVADFAYQGGAGNDNFILYDFDKSGTITAADFAAINGGGGSDTVSLAGNGQVLDLSDLGGKTISDVAAINLAGDGTNSLSISAATLQAIKDADTTNPLLVTGAAGSQVNLGDGFTYQGLSGSHHVFTNGDGNILHVSQGLNIAGVRYAGGSGDDNIILYDFDGNGLINSLDFASLDGGGGNDTLSLGGNGLTLDLDSLSGGGLADDIVAINLAGDGTNSLSISAATLQAIKDADTTNPLMVSGYAGSQVNLGDGFVYQGFDGAYHEFANSQGNILHVAGGLNIANVVYSGDAVNDTFILYDFDGNGLINADDFASIAGGGGNDTLSLAGNGQTLDLADLGGKTISGVAAINLAGDGTNGLSITAATLHAMRGSDQATPLVVTGAAGSRVLIDPAFVPQASLPDYYVFKNSQGNILHVDKNLAYGVGASGDSNDNTFILYDYAGNGVLEAGLFSINGEGGNDTVRLDGDGKLLDLSSATANSFANVELIDLAGSGGNQLIASGAALAAIRGTDSATPLVIEGAAGSEVSLSGDLVYQGLSGVYHVFTNSDGNILHVHNSLIVADFAYQGGAGNDNFILYDFDKSGAITAADFAAINGGGGSDTVSLAGNGQVLDLSDLGGKTISDVAAINLAGDGTNSLSISAATLQAIKDADTTNPLVVSGYAGSQVNLGDGFTYQGLNGSYHVFTNSGGNILHVHSDLTVVDFAYQGGAGNDTFILYDFDKSGTITAADFAAINGGGGNDTVSLAGNGQVLDLADLGGKTISDVAAINLAGDGTNSLSISAATLQATKHADTTNPLVVTGYAGSQVNLGDGFIYQGFDGTYHEFTNSQGNILHVAQGLNIAGVQYAAAAPGAVFTLHDFDGSGGITAADFAAISGLGNDTLSIGGPDNLSIDLTGLAAGDISNTIEAIDLSGHGSNALKLDSGAVALLGGTLTIDGESGDSVVISGGWNLSGTDNDYNVYTDGTNTVSIHQDIGAVTPLMMPFVGFAPSGGLAFLTGADAFSDSDFAVFSSGADQSGLMPQHGADGLLSDAQLLASLGQGAASAADGLSPAAAEDNAAPMAEQAAFQDAAHTSLPDTALSAEEDLALQLLTKGLF